MGFAEYTKVPVQQTRQEIERLVEKYGAQQFVYGYNQEKATIGFSMEGRQVRFSIGLEGLTAQKTRRAWRSLLLVIKAKLESVESGIEVFDDAFMSQIVMPDGKPMGEWVRPQIASMYEKGTIPPLLEFSR